LAAVAVTGGAFAQATLTGAIAYGYLATTSGAGATASGGGMDTSTLKFTATEDLGDGNSVTAYITTDGSAGRGGSMAMDDQEIILKTPGFTLNAGSKKGGDWLTGASGGATYYGLDGRVLSTRTANEELGISVPVMAGLTASISMSGPDNVVVEGTGNGGSTAQSATSYTLKYAAGPLAVKANYKGYTNNYNTDSYSNNISRVGAIYDLGVAKIGAAWDSLNYGGTGTRSRSMFSASAPVGPLDLNFEWASTSTTSTTLTAGSRTGYMFGAQYNLSKRTYAVLNYGSWLKTVGDSQNTGLTAVTIAHSF
jgi:hypothetical protein